MIAGNINILELATLPKSLYNILSRPEMTLANLQSLADGRYQQEGEEWFYNISDSFTSPENERHTEFHKQFLDIQLILNGEEIIGYSLSNAINEACYEKKPDLFILQSPKLTNKIHLKTGDFVTFYPGEPHQALCMVEQSQKVRKAVFKVPIHII
ncbi:YhcH/YjgK/YiaL family protein [uncultured Gilliamella sp.]|jgi:uncharacterized protein, YhcH/YjgK/YiaL family|uniref:YhcH/YjgK/YiaL family protein n=1 Tax=uncultured Gilliamella sp. TaxID=1193505 RepID=UPI0025F73CFF|nr:YhcH/YjgK/YiaL family protein [uncultured Gilliamella sp.]